MRVWWCNQSDSWETERYYEVVCSSKFGKSETGRANPTYRKTVGAAKAGDLIIHYCKPHIVAFSQAREDGREFQQWPYQEEDDDYGEGWLFETEYVDLSNKIPREKYAGKFKPNGVKYYAFDKDGKLNQGYFFVFDLSGLSTILSLVEEDEALPAWLEVHRQQHPMTPADAIEVPDFWEGALSKTTTNVYQRNPDARRLCLEHYGTSCVVCGLDLGERYGWAGEGVIHVHHLKLISEPGESYKVDPIDDLRPVCPNCHSVIHRRVPPYSIEEVQTFLDGGSDGKSKKPSTKNKRPKNKRTRMMERLAGKPRRGDSQ